MAAEESRSKGPENTGGDAPPIIELDRLTRAGALIPGRVGQCQWVRDGVAVGRIGLRAEAGRITLAYRYRNAAGAFEDVCERVRVIRRKGLAGVSRFFVCPGRRAGAACRKRVTTLYSTGRYFLCRYCFNAHAPRNRETAARPSIRVSTARACAVMTTLSAIVVSANAVAGGFMIRENSASGVGTVFAGNGSRADAPSTVFNNPAGMTHLLQDEVELGATVIDLSMTFSGTATAGGFPVSGGNGGDAGRVAFVPNAYWVFGINDRLKAGLGITVPFGNGASYNSPWIGRYLNVKTTSVTADINPSIAFKATDWLSLGAGVSAQYLKLDLTTAIAQFAIFGPGTPDAFYRFNANDWAFGYNVGTLFELGQGTRLGLTYRSAIDHRIKGSLDFMGTAPVLNLISGPAAADFHLPATTGVSITHEMTPNLSLSADVQFTQWSSLQTVFIESQNPPFPFELHYRDTWMISVGGVYRVNDQWQLRAGLGWDQTPVTDKFRMVNLPDEDRYLVGLGLGYKLNNAMSLDLGYQHSFEIHASMNDSVNNTDPFTHAVTLHGKYNVPVNIVSFSLRWKY
jgi:long-chain fatty acid transport protein